ncbi:MAG: N-methyltryptophan oxidase [Isosphaeraceae bacterium]|jgi:sarcosine oxidase|nr:MAG: N-methyltryptophan oxidase [Isosphaeraceae bacterium]
MEVIEARNVVVGAGVVGAAAAYHLARRGEAVLLVEQFGLGHTRGSSHGATRIIRHSYADPNYARLMPRVYQLWHALEAQSATPLLTRTGGISVSPPGVPYAELVEAALVELGVPAQRLSAEAWNQRHPRFAVPSGSTVVFEPDVGILAAGRCVHVLLHEAERHGACIQPNTPIDRIELETSGVALLGKGLRIQADRAIVAAGSWIPILLPALAQVLTPTRQRVVYLGTADPGYGVGRLPVFIWIGAREEQAYYGMPDLDGRGVKMGRHHGPATNPNQADERVDEAYVDELRGFLRGFLPELAEAPLAATETCLYTMAPGEEFLVGAWPGRSDLLVAAACSGHGFKFGILVGEVLADLATGQTPMAGTERWGATLAGFLQG